jgi:NO-binding membrane sensor protein with MHYT domain/nitrogen-specific signal transduction histidine kinase
MQASYNSWLVALSILVAMIVAYTALKLAARVAEAGAKGGRLWLLGGTAAMGTGIWSMHFIGMLAFSVAIPLQYSVFTTLASLVIAMVTSGFALSIASRNELSLQRLASGALVMGTGICAMHYSGMAAIQIMPMITYEPWLVAASVLIAVVASFVALWLAFKLRSGNSRHISLARAGAAVVMGLAISGMHYTAMAAAKLAVGSYCSGGATFDNDWLALAIGLFALGVLAITLITAVYDAHLASQARQDALRLEQVNNALQHGKNLLALATRAAGISCWEMELATQQIVWAENEIDALHAAGIDTTQCPDAILTATHADDRNIMFEAIRCAIADRREICTYRFRVVTPTGTAVHLEAHAQIFCDEHRHPLRILGVSWDVTEQVLQEERRRELQSQLRDVSREAGMAEVATGVLHSVGNVLNSLGVSAALLQSRLRDSRVGNLQRVAALLVEQGDRLGQFFISDQRGRQTPDYLVQLGEHLQNENQTLATEAQAISAHIGHIRNIVAAQQTYARRGGLTESVDIAELVDSAIAMHFTDTTNVSIKREYEKVAPITLDRHKLLQILGNLLSNARHALNDNEGRRRALTLRICAQATDLLAIEVEDSGTGIDAITLSRLFEFGFTTKKDGHGFGLHSSAILAKELRGDLSAHSDGKNCGARFVLRLRAASQELRERKQA